MKYETLTGFNCVFDMHTSWKFKVQLQKRQRRRRYCRRSSRCRKLFTFSSFPEQLSKFQPN